MDERAHMRAHLTHGRADEADLIVCDREMPADRREEELTPNGRSHDGPHRHVVHGDLSGDALGDPIDGLVVFKASQEDGVRSSVERVSEIELERIAIQHWSGRQVRKAGAEYCSPTQRHDCQHRSEKGAPDWNGPPTGPSLQSVTYADHRAWRCTIAAK